MPNNGNLAKQAIDAALKGQWKKAVEINSEILEKKPEDLDTKIRLGRAYLQIKEYSKAKKLFKEVLEIDPINKIAQKNYDLAKAKAPIKNGNSDNRDLITKPGTSISVIIETEKKTSTYKLIPGEDLTLRLNKSSVSFKKGKKKLGLTDNKEVVSGVKRAKNQGAKLSATFVSERETTAKILIKSNIPTFKGEKQVVRPYIKEGIIEEPEIEIPEMESNPEE